MFVSNFPVVFFLFVCRVFGATVDCCRFLCRSALLSIAIALLRRFNRSL